MNDEYGEGIRRAIESPYTPEWYLRMMGARHVAKSEAGYSARAECQHAYLRNRISREQGRDIGPRRGSG